jgi:ribose transport system ATP-binding protein
MLAVLAGLLAADDTAPSVFVMDEPTAALTQAEADRLFAVIADLKATGCGDPLRLAPSG